MQIKSVSGVLAKMIPLTTSRHPNKVNSKVFIIIRERAITIDVEKANNFMRDSK